jgi:hypothetical protein
VDVTAAARLRTIADEFARKGIQFFMTEHIASVNDQLREFGAEDLIAGGVIRQHIESALEDAGIRQPYPLAEGVPARQAESEAGAGRHIAEFEWAFGDEAEERMEEFAELLAGRMIEEAGASGEMTAAMTEDMIDAAEEETFGSTFEDIDEEHFLDLLERHVDRIGHLRHVQPERISRIEEKVLARHRRLAERIAQRRGSQNDKPETIATLKINTEGMGTLAYGVEGEEVEFDDEFPNQSTVVNLSEPQTYVIKAKADEGWKFVKWTKDGTDFSEEPEITVEVSEDVEYIAVFETE